jgi:tRNA (guanosine-2'-O-)-methyltransferase
VLLGHERNGVPVDCSELIDEVVEIPMVGRGRASTSGSPAHIVPYRLAGLA